MPSAHEPDLGSESPRSGVAPQVGEKPAAGRSVKAAKVPPEIRVRVSWCKGCGLCVEYCNRDVLEMQGVLPVVVNAERCSACLQCEAICPDFAIEILERESEVEK